MKHESNNNRKVAGLRSRVPNTQLIPASGQVVAIPKHIDSGIRTFVFASE